MRAGPTRGRRVSHRPTRAPRGPVRGLVYSGAIATSSAREPAILTLKGLRALRLAPVDLTLAGGECVVVQGASGSGKSVLLRAIADLDPHDGDALLDGTPCATMPAHDWRRRVAYVPAESGWWLDTVRPHFAPELDLPAAMARLGLRAELADAPVMRLSTGERQRLALLRAWRPGVRVLLLDEPTSGLDGDSTAAVEAWLADALRDGIGVLMVTHSDAQAQRLGSRRLRMADGMLQAAA